MHDVSAIRPGTSTPLGATWDGTGTNFAIFSEHATKVELCLFDQDPPHAERRRIPLAAHHGPVWHVYVPGVMPGALYGYRVHGPYKPDDGDRFNPAKLLIDPYAKAISGEVDWSAPVYGHRRPVEPHDGRPDGRDDAWGMPKSVVVDPAFDWQGDASPNIPWRDTVVYEAHVKGLTARHPEVPVELRGTYLGVSSPVMLEHYKRLGVTAIELLPVHAFVDDDFLVKRGLRNYWGYNTLGFFAPERRYATDDHGGQVTEFKAMVRTLHAAGLEVLLDVVYNHTAEGGHLGPTLSFRGIDNRGYYRLFHGQPRYYDDVTGTGNTLNLAHPQVLKLVMDSLRYWVQEMHVDGFRFDLAPALAREEYGFHRSAAFFRAIHQDPVLSTVKLIAEPWDIGDGGYQLGQFPDGWSEWNDRYRDTTRRFWRGDSGVLGELGFRLTGSADLFHVSKRGPHASVNFVTAHDGFTLRDLVTYEHKNNHANGEGNRDGSDHNSSWNHGHEGPTSDPELEELRLKQMRNLLATLFLSQGVPMLLAGDELGRTQGGNNNAYCQDNEVSWIDWADSPASSALTEFTRTVIAARARLAALRNPGFYAGTKATGRRLPDIVWYRPDGERMTFEEWRDRERRAISFRLAPPALPMNENQDLSPVFIAVNGNERTTTFRLPSTSGGGRSQWDRVFSTGTGPGPQSVRSGGRIHLEERSIVLYRHAVTPQEH